MMWESLLILTWALRKAIEISGVEKGGVSFPGQFNLPYYQGGQEWKIVVRL